MQGFNKLKGYKIRADSFKKDVISRKMFVDPDIEKQIKQKIKNNDPILFMPTSVQSVSDFLGGDNTYPTKFLLIGTTFSGSKASVLLNNPPIYCDVFCHKLVEDSTFDYCPDATLGGKVDISTILNDDFLRFVGIFGTHCASRKYKYREYICKKIYNIGDPDFNKHIGIRIWFDKKKDMIDMLRSLYPISEFFVASNVSDPFNFAFITNDKYCGNWMLIYDYRHLKYSKTGFTNKVFTKAKHNFICEFNKFVVPVDDRNILHGMSLSELWSHQGRNLEITWDIETKEVKDEDDDDDTNQNAVNKHNKIFNICMTITDTSKTDNVLLTIGLFRPKYKGYVKFENDDFDIMCNNQKELLLAFAKLINYLQPDIMTTFNGNNFDIPVYLLQCRIEKIFEKVHCKASIMATNSTKNMKMDSRGVLINKSGYPLWTNVHTTSIVSGIRTGKYKHLEPKKFKLEKDVNLEYHYWNIGVIHLDLFMISKKKYPKILCSLSNMLKENKLNISKDDLGYAEIWRRWDKSSTFESIRDPEIIQSLSEIDKYCKQDCYCTYKLREKYMILEEKRSMCVYTHLPMETVIYQADGIKVESGLGSLYSKGNYVYVSNKIHKDMLPGSHLMKYHVEPPALYNQGAIVEIWTPGKVCVTVMIDGVARRLAFPASALDVQSLYPSLIINYGLSLDAMRFTRPKNIEDYDEHYLPDMPKELLNDIPDKKIWIRKHHGKFENFAVVPKFLQQLFNDRLEIKAKLAELGKQRGELMDRVRAENPKSVFAQTQHNLSGPELDNKYEKYCINLVKDEVMNLDAMSQTINARQNTIKVLMNTVYGVTKFPSNIFYCFFIAHLVTKNGRELITYINKIISENGATVDYNDTDSAYYHHNSDYYMDIITKRYKYQSITELQYRKKMSLRCMKLNVSRKALEFHYIKKLSKLGIDFNKSDNDAAIEKRTKFAKYTSMEDIVNNAIKSYTGYSYLRMVIEEVLFPVSFFAKKKYFGFNHGVGFREEITMSNLIVKGISYVTRQTSQIQKDFNKNIMLKMVTDLDSDCEEALLDAIVDFYNTEHSIDKYLVTFTNKPSSNNPRVRPFVQRMMITGRNNPDLAHLYYVPGPLETFRYAIIRKNITRTLRGTMKKFKKTDVAEYEEVIKYFGYEIDKDHYLMSLVSTFAQFLTYKDFPFKKPGMSIKDYKQAIEKKHVKPLFKTITSENEYNKRILEADSKINVLYKLHKTQFEKYVSDRYPSITNVLMNMYRSTKDEAYLFMVSGAKKTAIKPVANPGIRPEDIKKYMNPTLDEIHLAKMIGKPINKPELVLFLNGDEIKKLEARLESYRPYLRDIELRLERVVYEYMLGSDGNVNYDDLPDIISELEMKVLEEFNTNLTKYVVFMQYWNIRRKHELGL